MADLLTNIMQAIILIGLIVLGIWTKRWIDALNGTVAALKGTVDAQSQTITSQKTLLENLGNVLNAADTPKMLERVEAYKKFVDQEKEVLAKTYERQLAELQNLMSQTASRTAEAVTKEFVTTKTSLVGIIAGLMPHVPRVERITAIAASSPDDAQLKETLQKLANQAPDLARVYLEALVPGVREERRSDRSRG
jgi:hypothetical protein